MRRERHDGRGPRVDYDAVAHLYDTQPYRARAVDPELLALAGQDQAGRPAVLDIGCGTGNQLIANRGALPEAFYAGLEIVRRRDTCSQLQAIPEAAYQAGVERLARDAIDPNLPPSRDDHLCLVTIRGAAPAAGIDAAREVTSG